jgi:hypothetical protein
MERRLSAKAPNGVAPSAGSSECALESRREVAWVLIACIERDLGDCEIRFSRLGNALHPHRLAIARNGRAGHRLEAIHQLRLTPCDATGQLRVAAIRSEIALDERAELAHTLAIAIANPFGGAWHIENLVDGQA